VRAKLLLALPDAAGALSRRSTRFLPRELAGRGPVGSTMPRHSIRGLLNREASSANPLCWVPTIEQVRGVDCVVSAALLGPVSNHRRAYAGRRIDALLIPCKPLAWLSDHARVSSSQSGPQLTSRTTSDWPAGFPEAVRSRPAQRIMRVWQVRSAVTTGGMPPRALAGWRHKALPALICRRGSAADHPVLTGSIDLAPGVRRLEQDHELNRIRGPAKKPSALRISNLHRS